MIPVDIEFTEKEYVLLTAEAKKKGKTISDIVNQCLANSFNKTSLHIKKKRMA